MKSAGIWSFASRKTVLSLALLLFFLCASACIAKAFESFSDTYTERLEVYLDKNFYKPGDICISHSGLKYVYRHFLNENGVSYTNRFSTVASSGSISEPAVGMMTDYRYMNFADFRMTRGSFLNEKECRNGSNVAVISEDMAAKLYLGADILGSDIDLSGKPYRIIGIYKPKNTLFSMLGSDGADKVYIPFSSVEGADAMPIETFYLYDGYLEGFVFRAQLVGAMLQEDTYINPDIYKVYDYYNSYGYMKEPGDIFAFLVAILCICIIAAMFIAYIRKNAAYMRMLTADYYPVELIRKKIAYILRFFIGASLFILACVSIFLLARITVSVPAEISSHDNIFDLRYYMDVIKSHIFFANSATGYVFTGLARFLRYAWLFIAVCMVGAIPAFISMVSGIKLLKRSGCGIVRFAGYSAVSCILAAILLLIASPVWGGGIVIPLKHVVIIFIFCIVLTIDRSHLGTRLDNLVNHDSHKDPAAS